MIRMKTLKNVEKYSEIYDEIMNAELELVYGAYDYDQYSIKIPNSMSGLELVEMMDGDQPMYNTWKDLPECLKHDRSLADYPRHNNTLRLFFDCIVKAQAALKFIKEERLK